MIKQSILTVCLSTASALGQAYATSTIPIELEVDVTVVEFGPNGKNWDGARIYLLPFEMTTVSPPELAICAHTNAGETTCSPDPAISRSSCPDSYRCKFDVRFTKPFTHLTISVFDIDAVGQDALHSAGRLLGDGVRLMEGLIETDLSADRIEQNLQAANSRRWSWIETVSFQVNLPEGERARRDVDLERRARNYAGSVVPPQLSSFQEGRIAAPFDIRPLGDCLFPMPACSYGYTTLALRSTALEEKLASWD